MSVADIDMNRNFRKVLERHKQDLCQVILSKESKVLEKLVECGLVKLEEVEMMLTLTDRKIIEGKTHIDKQMNNAIMLSHDLQENLAQCCLAPPPKMSPYSPVCR